MATPSDPEIGRVRYCCRDSGAEMGILRAAESFHIPLETRANRCELAITNSFHGVVQTGSYLAKARSTQLFGP